MMKDLLPPMTDEDIQRHYFLAQKGHLNSKEQKEWQILDQQKRESVLTPQERQNYEATRSIEAPTDSQKIAMTRICDKAGIELPRKFQYIKAFTGPSSTAKPAKVPWYYYVLGAFLGSLTIVILDNLIGAIINNAKTGWLIRVIIELYFILKFPQNLAERRRS